VTTGTEHKTSILLVDDDEVYPEPPGACVHRSRLRRHVPRSDSRHGGRTAARAESPEMAVIDLKMPGKSGLELLRALHEIDPNTKVVVLTGYGSIATAIDAVRLGATYYLAKPADADEILAAFARGQAPPLEPPDVDYKAPSLARAEWEHINRVLSDCGGNISEAARRLGIHRRSLQRKLHKYPPAK
jgi:two-component system response regulator RegA